MSCERDLVNCGGVLVVLLYVKLLLSLARICSRLRVFL